ncbi:sigma-70 family RNA polymerase sigma factor [Altererythrobacter sp.]|nr:sigma-70 family RNA polymerase sigma factor [Altererythrobacter sp.]
MKKKATASVPNSVPETICRTTEFVQEHTGWMLRTATGIVVDRQIAEDVVQESFVKVFEKSDQFSGIAPLRRWMHRIVVNQALMALRKHKRTQQREAHASGPEFNEDGCRLEDKWSNLETPETILRSSQNRDQVLAAISALPEKYRLVVLLRDIEELPTSETALILEITEANVKVRLHRARSNLKSILEPLLRGNS